MASLIARNNTIWISYYLKGKLIRKSLQIPDTKEGWKKANQVKQNTEADLKRNNFTNYLHIKSIRLSEAIKLFYKDKYDGQGEVFNCAFLHLQNLLGDPMVSKITFTDIEKVKDYILDNKAHETAVSYTNHIRILFGWLIKNRYYTDDNPVIKLKSIAQPVTSISDTDFKIILNYLAEQNPDAYNFIKFLKLTGCRLSEGMNMTWDNIDFHKNLIYIHNTKEHRIDIFPMYDALRQHLFSWHDGNHIGKLFIYNERRCYFWYRAMKKLKMNYCIHDIRRTFATTYATKLMPIELMKIMRHKDIRTTMRFYVNLDVISLGQKLNNIAL